MTLLSICVPALSQRPWQRVVDELNRQSVGQPVEIIVERDNGELTSGQKRNILMDRAAGQYIAQLDDDDWIEPDYVAALVEGCMQNPDVVTFKLEMNHRRLEVWSFGLHRQNRSAGQMTVNHLCAWKTDLARRVAFDPKLGYADDQVWYQPLFNSGLVKTEIHVSRVLHHYLFDQRTTQNQTSQRIQFCKWHVGRGLKCFMVGGEILIQVGGISNPATGVVVRDRRNVESFLPTEGLTPFHTITVQ